MHATGLKGLGPPVQATHTKGRVVYANWASNRKHKIVHETTPNAALYSGAG